MKITLIRIRMNNKVILIHINNIKILDTVKKIIPSKKSIFYISLFKYRSKVQIIIVLSHLNFIKIITFFIPLI